MNRFLFLIFIFIPFNFLMAGEMVQDFTLEDFNGTSYKLSNYNDNEAIVLLFISSQCPVSNAYNERMNKLYTSFHSKGVAFIGINSNSTETTKQIKQHAVEKDFMFPVLIDRNNVIADRLGASVTPEVFVLNSKRELVYHGRIDDSKNPDNITSHDLEDALFAIITGKQVPTATTKAFGCSIKKVN